MEFNCLNISAVLQHTGKTTTMNFSLSDLLVQINFPRYRRHHGTCLHLTDPEIEDRFHWKDTKYTTKNSNAPSSITESMKSSPSIPILNKTESSKRHFRPVVAVNVVRSKAESPRWKFFPSHLTVNIVCNSKWLVRLTYVHENIIFYIRLAEPEFYLPKSGKTSTFCKCRNPNTAKDTRPISSLL